MQRRFRLSRSEDFKRVRRTGKSYAHPLVVLMVQASEGEERLRIGVAAGKTVGGAVVRNRAKRLLREAMRGLIPSVIHKLDEERAANQNLILIARSALATAALADVRSALTQLLRRAKLLSVDEPRN
ncbi:MAG: ribonuclease P protein component [Anaerolineales bacterium]|nr:ribonuclease P protein component [Anaerolineales bacterium]